MRRATYSVDDILNQLDASAQDYTFPMLDNGYFYPGDVRQHLYRDDRRWALVIEELVYSPRAHGIYCTLSNYGNCLRGPTGASNEDYVRPVEEAPAATTHNQEGSESAQEAAVMRIRGRQVRINLKPSLLASKGIELEKPPRVAMFELMRALLPKHREQLLATEEERRRRIPLDIPCILEFNEWNHPDVGKGELPSKSETFRLIASVLVKGNPSLYRPSKPANTHWKNWPEGGTL